MQRLYVNDVLHYNALVMNDDFAPNVVGACEAISRQVVLKSHAHAAAFGLSPSDFEHLTLLIQSGPMTAGHLATQTGLTTGAITGIIDRLEEAGFVQRQQDATDRRRIIIVPSGHVVKAIIAIQKKSHADFQRCLATYSSDEIKTILAFLRTTTDFLHKETIRLTHDN